MTSNNVVKAFTELAPRYGETMDQELRRFWGLSYREFVDRLIETVSVGEDNIVLDVATGTAYIPLKLMDTVGGRGQIVGLDITPAMLKHGRENVEASESSSRIGLVCASAMEMPFIESFFDIAICGLGTHHMDVPRMLSEVRRVLKTGGKLVVADVGASAFWRSLWGIALLKILLIRYGLANRSARAQAEVEAFSNVRTASEWRTILSDFGFTKIEIAESPARRFWYPHALTIRAVARGT
jgi:ubiquinone/menaquinone biosynthesis C-methylase UbiE